MQKIILDIKEKMDNAKDPDEIFNYLKDNFTTEEISCLCSYIKKQNEKRVKRNLELKSKIKEYLEKDENSE